LDRIAIPARSPALVKLSADIAAGVGFGAGGRRPAIRAGASEGGLLTHRGWSNAERRWEFRNSIGALPADAMRATKVSSRATFE
jgi:hypothetical protein